LRPEYYLAKKFDICGGASNIDKLDVTVEFFGRTEVIRFTGAHFFEGGWLPNNNLANNQFWAVRGNESFSSEPNGFISGFRELRSGLPERKRKDGNECSSDGGYCVSAIIQDNKEAITSDARTRDEKVHDFGWVFFGGLLGLLTLFCGHTLLK
jgi:hypothetical protein